MLRLLLLCAFVTVGLGLSAQETAAKTSCNPAHCASKSTASTSCQAKTTSVAATTTPVPERANAVAEKQVAPIVAQPALFKLTSLTPTPANCQPADCNKICEPSQCASAKGTSTAAAPAAKKTTLAVKQE